MVQQPVNELQLIVKAIGYFKTHWWLILVEVISVFSAGIYIFHRTPQVFESHGALLIDSSRRQIYQQVFTPGNPLNQLARRQNIANLFTSNEALDRALTQLVGIYEKRGTSDHLDFFFPFGKPLAAGILRFYTSFGWDRNSDIYNLTCTGPNPLAARDICLSYMNAIQAYYPEIGQRETVLKHDYIQKEIKSLTTQITEKETALAEFERKNMEFMTFSVMDTGEKGLKRLHEDENNTKERMAINRAVRDLLVRSRTSKAGVHNTLDTTVNALTLRLQDLQYQLQLTQESKDKTKDQSVSALNSEINRVSSQIARLNEVEVEDSLRDPIPSSERRKRVADLELEYRTDGVRLQGIREEINLIQTQEKKFQVQRIEYTRYQSDLENRKKLLAQLYEKEQEAELDLSAGGAEIFRLEEPVVNGARVSPILTRNLFAALSLSIFVTIATLILLIALVPRLDSEAEMNRLNIPILGKVPSMRGGPIFGDRDATFGFEYAKIMNYRILRETKDIKCPIIVITSANAREGKSTVTNLLAMASESRERKTLLIDGDLLTLNHNKPFKIHEDATPGIKSVLDRKQGQLAPLAVATAYDGVSLLPRGARVETSVLPNFLDPVRKALEEARKEYDMIIIDTPPLFQSNLAHQWAGLSDLVVLVARLYYTRPRDVIEAIQTIKIFSKAPVGTALNCVPVSGLQRRGTHYYYFSRKKPKAPNLAA